ncbi:MAG: hypothetical protein ABIO35_08275 [Nitrobacter sp.]
MATLYIAESDKLAQLPNQQPQVMPMPPLREQTLSIDAVKAGVSKPFSKQTSLIVVSSDVQCCIAVGDTEDLKATASNMPIWPKTEYWFGVQPGQRISVIGN